MPDVPARQPYTMAQARAFLDHFRYLLDAGIPVPDPGNVEKMRFLTRSLDAALRRVADLEAVLHGAGPDAEARAGLAPGRWSGTWTHPGDTARAIQDMLGTDIVDMLAVVVGARHHLQQWAAREMHAYGHLVVATVGFEMDIQRTDTPTPGKATYDG